MKCEIGLYVDTFNPEQSRLDRIGTTVVDASSYEKRWASVDVITPKE